MTREKRPAFESPAVLAEPVTPPAAMRRPTATTFGALLVVLRVVAGIVWLIALALQWDDVLQEGEVALDLPPSEAASVDALLLLIVIVGVIVLVIELGLAVAVYFGSNAARLTVMIFATLSITISAIDYFGEDAEITLRTTLVTLALDILVLLALSSRAARAYARRPRPRHPRQ
ncbi:MAG: hypothetical protein M3Y52_10170 [Actinomycetota bacterium]|jgi:hypothetical protein|nr:hypothetical protein [Actinomycetota bacterium]